MPALFSYASGTSRDMAASGDRPVCTSSSSTLSSMALSDPPSCTTGSSSRNVSANRGEESVSSRMRIQFTLPVSVLISPLCASMRNGCAVYHMGNVLVEYRW